MALNPGRDTTISATLKLAGTAVPIPSGATVTAQLFASDGVTALGDAKPLVESTVGSDWSAGLVVVEFDAADTTGITGSAVIVQFVVVGTGINASWSIRIPVDTGKYESSVLFPDRSAALADLRGLLAFGAGRSIDTTGLSDDLLWSKLMAAEADVARKLRVFLGPTEVIPDEAPQSEIDALEQAGTPYVQIASFDYEPHMFANDAWGLMRLPYKPVQQVHSVKLDFPAPFLQSFVVPPDWLRVDRKYGDLRITPTTSAVVSPVGAFALVNMGGSQSYPQAVQVRYRCGLVNASGQVVSSVAPHYDDLLDAVRRMAVLKLMNDAFLSSSSSISADGLSQSESFDITQWQGGIDDLLFGPKGSGGGIYASIHGITLGVLR